MTNRLREAFRIAAEHLPEQEQDVLTAAIIAEVAGEPGWDIRFAQSQECLAEMADEALADARAGRARRLDPSRI
jgi:hypothetical protein